MSPASAYIGVAEVADVPGIEEARSTGFHLDSLPARHTLIGAWKRDGFATVPDKEGDYAAMISGGRIFIYWSRYTIRKGNTNYYALPPELFQEEV